MGPKFMTLERLTIPGLDSCPYLAVMRSLSYLGVKRSHMYRGQRVPSLRPPPALFFDTPTSLGGRWGSGKRRWRQKARVPARRICLRITSLLSAPERGTEAAVAGEEGVGQEASIGGTTGLVA